MIHYIYISHATKIILKKIRFISIIFVGWKLALKGYANYDQNYRRKQQWKIVFHIIFNPTFAYNWFDIVESTDFEHITQHRPRIYIKPFRPYISIKWNKEQKIKVILDTYRFIKIQGGSFSQILTNKEGVIVANLIFDNTYEFILKLGYDDRFRKEGELVLSLECAKLWGKIISVAFSFEELPEGDWVCLIGCVQGHNNINSSEAIKLTQKLFYGLRPNSFIIWAVQEISRNLGCTSIYCAGDSIQAYRRKHAIHLPGIHSIHFNYDKFWQEVGGQDIDNGWFELPIMPTRKDIHEIQSHKRSLYRKRYDMLDNLSHNITIALKELHDISQ